MLPALLELFPLLRLLFFVATFEHVPQWVAFAHGRFLMSGSLRQGGQNLIDGAAVTDEGAIVRRILVAVHEGPQLGIDDVDAAVGRGRTQRLRNRLDQRRNSTRVADRSQGEAQRAECLVAVGAVELRD